MEVNEAINNAGSGERRCENCKIASSPLWRKHGPVKFLCNACGLYYKVNGEHRPYYMSKNKLNSSAKKPVSCGNCNTSITVMWRKAGGRHVCNACGLYLRINGHNRPVTMRKDIIRTRKRRDTTSFEMLNPMESCPASEPVLTDIKNESTDSTDFEKHPYKMMLNISRDHHPFVLTNNNESHHIGHYGQHVCQDNTHHSYHHHHSEGNFGSHQVELINNTNQIDANNGYYCPFF